MIDEDLLRRRAREALQTGKMPNAQPARIWGGNGFGMACVICGAAIGKDQVATSLNLNGKTIQDRLSSCMLMRAASLRGSWSERDRRYRHVSTCTRFARSARFHVVSASPTEKSERRGAITLGDLLYADAARDRVAEAEWAGLVHSVAASDQGALRALYDRSHRLVFALAMRITGNRQTAEEVTLDVFHDVWRRASAYDAETGSVLGWIMNQARSRSLDRLRFDQRKKRLNADGADAVGGEDADDSSQLAQRRDDNRLLQTALANLSDEEREAIETAFFSELTYAEVATHLHQPLGTIKTRIRSGLMKLRRALMQE